MRRALATIVATSLLAGACGAAPTDTRVASVFNVRAEPALGCWPWKPSQLRSLLVVAHKTMPCGTRVRVCYTRCVTARVRDRGPYVAGRDFDLSLETADAAGVPYGVYRVRVTVLGR